MSTGTSSSGTTPKDVERTNVAQTNRVQSWLLIVLVFVAGASSLAVEFAASRLLTPYFGDSLFVWANLIGLILLYLSVGYTVGGRLADRYPRSAVLYGLTALAALVIGAIPLLSYPFLAWAQIAFANTPPNGFYGSLVSILLLFSLPMILLGCVSPFAIRLRVKQVKTAGHTAGYLYALSTVGSIVGTFLPVFVLIPDLGTALTFLCFAGALLFVSLVGLLLAGFAH